MNGVTVRPLGEVAALQAGVGFPLDLQGRSNGKYPLAKVGDISRGGRSGEAVLSSADHFVDEIDLERLRAKPIPAGSVLFAKIGEAIRQNHRVIAGCPLLIDNNAMAAIPGPEIESRYLYYFLRTVDFYRIASATTVPALRKSELERIGVPLFALPEQRRIAEVLDRAEALRAKRRAALAQLDTLTQSIFLDLFGNPATNPKQWTRLPLGKVIATGPQNGIYKPSSDYGSGTPILRIDAFYDGAVTNLASLKRVRVSESERQLYGLHCGDVVVNRVNSMEYLGKSALIPDLDEPTIFESNMMRFSVDGEQVEPKYVVEFLQTQFIKRQILTAAKNAVNQSSINQQDVTGFLINIPPLSLQQTFVTQAAAVDKLKSAHRASLAKLDALFASLQHRAFRGEL